MCFEEKHDLMSRLRMEIESGSFMCRKFFQKMSIFLSKHAEMPQGFHDHRFLLSGHLRLPAVRALRSGVTFPFFSAGFLLYLSYIQRRNSGIIFRQDILLYFFIRRTSRQPLKIIVVFRLIRYGNILCILAGQETYSFDVTSDSPTYTNSIFQ